MPLSLASGAIALSPLGPEAMIAGAAASLVSSAVAGAVLGLRADSRPMIAGPSSGIALAIAGMLSAATALGALPASAAGIGGAFVLIIVATALAGLMVALLVWLRLGSLTRMIPYPVLSGFVNGTAALLILSQVGPLLGEPIGAWPSLAEARPLALAVAAVGVAGMLWRPPGRLGELPALPRGLAAGWAADAVLRAAGLGGALGPLLGAPPDLSLHGASLVAAWQAWPGLLSPALIGPVLLCAAATAVLGSIETLAVAAALRERGGPRADLDRDLGALSLGDLTGAAVGGMPVGGSMAPTQVCLDAGGRTRLAAGVRGVLLVSILVALGDVVALVPQAALAGIVLGSALRLADAGTLRPLGAAKRTRRVFDAVVMLAVLATAVLWSLAVAVAVGIAMSVLAFTASMTGGVVRRAFRHPGARSRTRRPPAAETLLLREGGRIEVAELQGPLFFGSADAMLRHVEGAAETGADWVVLDLARLGRVDLSGGRQLVRLLMAPPQAGLRVLLSGLRPGLPARDDLEALGLLARLPPAALFETLEAALEAVEEEILAGFGAPGETALSAAEALARLGLAPADAAGLLPHVAERRFEAGGAILRAGEPPDALYILLAGTAEISLPREAGGALRIATIAPGAIFGEMAVLTGQPRSADVWARGPRGARCLRLEAAALARLEMAQPALALALLRAIARQIDGNLRMANTTIMALDG